MRKHKIHRMTIHIIFTNVIQGHVKGIEPLNSGVKGSDLYVVQRTYKKDLEQYAGLFLSITIILLLSEVSPCTCLNIKAEESRITLRRLHFR